ncbi:DNA topology modulation protein FlaR, partial [Eubacteriales bacterium OttesenSCG-928-M02]|nr:DNA topology modulation protein FlaR [Eubacteriales bacterium OttesenSCG-928-M02]
HMKIAVMGYAGAGKSTLAQVLGAHYNIPVLHLDTVQFLPGWKERPLEDGLRLVGDFMAQAHWVIDGNYTKFYQAERLEAADLILQLLFPRRASFWYAFTRYLKNRRRTRADMAEGCPEKFDLAFMWWILYKGRTRAVRQKFDSTRKQYEEKTVVLKSRKAVEAYVRGLKAIAPIGR